MNDLAALKLTSRLYSGNVDSANCEVSLDPEPPTLELLVNADMCERGFDPRNSEEVKSYWAIALQPKIIRYEQHELSTSLTKNLLNAKYFVAEGYPPAVVEGADISGPILTFDFPLAVMFRPSEGRDPAIHVSLWQERREWP